MCRCCRISRHGRHGNREEDNGRLPSETSACASWQTHNPDAILAQRGSSAMKAEPAMQ